MDHWQLAYVGTWEIPRELSEFELATFFTFSSYEQATEDREKHGEPCDDKRSDRPSLPSGACRLAGESTASPDGAEDNECHGFHALDAALEAVIGGSDGRWRR
ncbi:hypothetical protein [Cupriavidus necator]